MDRQTRSLIAHTDHPVAAPLDDSSVDRLLRRALPRGDERVLDLGCGEGAWLLRALHHRPGVTAEGVDVSEEALERARRNAKEARVEERLTLHRTEAASFAAARPFDVVLSVGAAHAFGGLLPTLDAARRHLAPGGVVLAGDAYWEREPSGRARELLGEYEDLAGTVDKVTADGWTPVYAHQSTRHELDDYEWNWTGSLSRWALDNPHHPDSAEALRAADRHREEWLRGYRDSFGFVCLLLRRTVE
ncbi:SAM-dependent methyltransferase [Streptomyces albus]|uniref:SAM-dependent methyltransferase n=1 Tax=Streptomyces TaxID=1883 RepID=UPI0004C25291|nr:MULTISPECIES: class I SAM-dependent methyltransferase [Streptomyces]KPC94202.1 SAM-dependent methyltransferase [Streptomyces sp. NRRL F-6602]QID36266.1 class I SAM-dependent methyltransferase [Streptomyces albus]GHJ21872.1 SAM-dependent methyltransferase [Streptomyces albus]